MDNRITYQPICISEDNHRFALEQTGKNVLIVIGVNPSTADEKRADPTMQRVVSFVNAFNYDGFVMLNLSSERTPNPNDLSPNLDYVFYEKNMKVISDMEKKYAYADILLAFGDGIHIRKYLNDCFYSIYKIFQLHKRWLCIGGERCITKSGNPRHPLYTSPKMGLYDFDIETYIQNKRFH